MQNNGRYISIKRVIENVKRNFRFSEDIDFYDAMEWVGGLIALLGSHVRLEQTVALLKVEDGRAKLPCDVHTIVQCGKRTSMRTPFGDTPKVFFVENDVVEEGESYIHDSSEVYVELTDQQQYFLEPMVYTGETSIMRYHCCDIDFNTNRSCGNTYTLNKNYMFTNFKSGKVEMFYLRIPMDDEGYPLIPDDESWIKACEWEIAFRMISRDYFAGMAKKDRFDEAEWQRNYYVAQAGTHDWTIDEMQQWANYMQDPFRQTRPHDEFFAHVSEPAHYRNFRA